MKNDVIYLRTLCNIVLVSLCLSLSGILIDLDHAYFRIYGHPSQVSRFVHYVVIENPVVGVVYAVIWGIVTFSFAIRLDLVE